MSKIIKTKIVSIYGLPGEGKTFIASFFSSFYSRVYSNIDFYRNEKKVNITINNITQLDTILEYSETLGLLVLDEAGVNVNARKSMSDMNLLYSKVAIYSRKYNLNVVIISQLERMADVYFREMSTYHYHMRSWMTGPDYMMFEVTTKNRYGEILSIKEMDLIMWSRVFKYTYNTLDKSVIKAEKKQKETIETPDIFSTFEEI